MGINKKVKKTDETGKEIVYDSIRIAAIRNCTTTDNISRCINGHTKTCCGYRWKVVEDKQI